MRDDLLERIYILAMGDEAERFFWAEFGDLREMRVALARRFVDATEKVMLDEMEGIVED